MTAVRELLAGYAGHVNRSGARLHKMLGGLVIERGEGCHLYTSEGERLLSCGGYSVFTMGHQHPDIVGPVADQLHRLAQCGPMLLHEGQVRAAEALVGICPEGLRYAFLLNSGAEAVELALKLARLHGRRKLVAAVDSYHGKTFGALSVTGKPGLRTPFAPLLPDVSFVPYGELAALEPLVDADTCVILEPVQGEAGVRIPPDGYLAGVAARCADAGALLVFDEIQTGLGRLGTMWGADAAAVRPDILLTGKALSGGVVPVSAVVATAEVYEPLNRDPMLHTTTFGGNPLAAAAVRHTVAALLRHDVPRRAAVLGERLLAEVRQVFAERCPELVREVRGRGLLLGVEFHETGLAGELALELLDRSVLVSNAINSQGTVRLTPPAFLTETDIRWLTDALRESADALAKRHDLGGLRAGS